MDLFGDLFEVCEKFAKVRSRIGTFAVSKSFWLVRSETDYF